MVPGPLVGDDDLLSIAEMEYLAFYETLSAIKWHILSAGMAN